MIYIYILQLESNKYYIGKTTNPSFCIQTHLNGIPWTQLYKPIGICDIISNCDEYDEDKYTIKYMKEYGINNVRGGSFSTVKLNDSNIITLKQMVNGSIDKCYICGSPAHIGENCNNDDNNIKSLFMNIYYYITSWFTPVPKPSIETVCIENDDTYRDIYMCKYCHIEYLSVNELIYHETKCKENIGNRFCTNCGRNTHIAINCIASTDIDNNIIF